MLTGTIFKTISTVLHSILKVVPKEYTIFVNVLNVIFTKACAGIFSNQFLAS